MFGNREESSPTIEFSGDAITEGESSVSGSQVFARTARKWEITIKRPSTTTLMADIFLMIIFWEYWEDDWAAGPHNYLELIVNEIQTPNMFLLIFIHWSHQRCEWTLIFFISNAALDFKGIGIEILKRRFVQDVIYRSQIIVVKLV